MQRVGLLQKVNNGRRLLSQGEKGKQGEREGSLQEEEGGGGEVAGVGRFGLSQQAGENLECREKRWYTEKP